MGVFVVFLLVVTKKMKQVMLNRNIGLNQCMTRLSEK